jgi:tetratricopeptide (TPR) repeat protein
MQCLESEIRRLMEQKQFRLARAKLRRLMLQLSPDDDEDGENRCAVWGGIAKTHYLEGALEQATEAIERSLRFHDRDSNVWELRGLIFWAYGFKSPNPACKNAFLEKALESYEQAIACCPPGPENADRCSVLRSTYVTLVNCLEDNRKNNTP